MKLLVSTLVFLSQCRTGTDRAEQAHADLERAFRLSPGIPETRVLLANSYLDTRRPEQAERLLSDGLDKAPDHLELLRAQATVKLQLSKSEDVLALARRALEANAETIIGPLCLSFLTHGKLNDAENLAKLALQYNKEQPYPYFTLGRVAHARKAYTDARDRFQEALQRLPQFPDLNLYADTLFFLGDSEASLGDPNRALPYFEKAVEVMPRSSRYQLTLAAFFARAGEPERAVTVADRWLERFPSKQNFALASQAFARLGLTEKAGEYRQKAESASQ